MGSNSRNTDYIAIFVGAEVQNVQENYSHFDMLQSSSAKMIIQTFMEKIMRHNHMTNEHITSRN